MDKKAKKDVDTVAHRIGRAHGHAISEVFGGDANMTSEVKACLVTAMAMATTRTVAFLFDGDVAHTRDVLRKMAKTMDDLAEPEAATVRKFHEELAAKQEAEAAAEASGNG